MNFKSHALISCLCFRFLRLFLSGLYLLYILYFIVLVSEATFAVYYFFWLAHWVLFPYLFGDLKKIIKSHLPNPILTAWNPS